VAQPSIVSCGPLAFVAAADPLSPAPYVKDDENDASSQRHQPDVNSQPSIMAVRNEALVKGSAGRPAMIISGRFQVTPIKGDKSGDNG